MVTIAEIKDCTAVILCGGKSSRMGFDKALLKVADEYVLLKTFTSLRKIFSNVILVTNDVRKFPNDFSNCRIIVDDYAESGPLGGLVTALESIETSHLFLMACDMPQLNVGLIRELSLYRQDYQVVVSQHGDYLEPLFAFYQRSALPLFQAQLATGDWRIRSVFERCSVKKIVKSQGLLNVNRPEELSQWH